jgi:hypothetical protein
VRINEIARVEGCRPVIAVGDEVRFDIGASNKGNGMQAIGCELLNPSVIVKRRIEEAERHFAR